MRTIVPILLFLTVLPALRASQSLRVGHVSIEWIDGFTLTREQSPQRFVGPEGEVVLITSMGLGPNGDVEEVTKRYLEFGSAQLLDLAKAKGKVVGNLSIEELHGEITLFSTATRAKDRKGWFYLQFFAVPRTGWAALFTIEGKGNPTEQLKRFRPVFDSLKWIHDEEEAANRALQTTPMTRSVYEKTIEFGHPRRGV